MAQVSSVWLDANHQSDLQAHHNKVRETLASMDWANSYREILMSSEFQKHHN